ncbi:YceI family protein [Bacteroidota bacterium]
MKNKGLFTLALALLMTVSAYSLEGGKLVSSKSHVKFFSTTPMEDIEANNYASVSTINLETGDVVFSVPMQGFEFENSAMQKHFNSENFLDTKAHPKSKLVGKITNLDEIDFSKDGEYEAMVEGELSIKGTSNPVKEKGVIRVKGKSIEVVSKFNVTLADYNISFIKGKPSTNVAKTVEVTALSEYMGF